jgi:hypothetical protein
MNQTAIPMRLSTMIPVTATIATMPAVPMLDVLGLVLFVAGPFDGGIGF